MICSLFFLWIYTDIFFNNCPELLCLFRIFQALNFRTKITDNAFRAGKP